VIVIVAITTAPVRGLSGQVGARTLPGTHLFIVDAFIDHTAFGASDFTGSVS
jgi:hypothetical protein